VKDRFTVIYLHTNRSVEVAQYFASSLFELTKLLTDYLISTGCFDLIEEEKLALYSDLNIYCECFPLIPIEDTVNVWIFSLASIDAYIFKMSPVVSD
jgi:hypothetical protein